MESSWELFIYLLHVIDLYIETYTLMVFEIFEKSEQSNG